MSFTQQFNDYNLQWHGVRLPQINIKQQDHYAYLCELVNQGFEQKIKSGQIDPAKAKDYADRCKMELDVFKKHHLVDYVLLVYDILNWCDQNEIARGIARGSGSGSCVFYLIGSNRIDPLKHSLPFTRFISPARLQSNEVDGIVYLNGKSMPDYDCDLSFYHRPKVIQQLETKYKGKTCKISTRIKLSGKILIKNLCKVLLNYSETESKEVSDLVERHFGKVEKLAKAYEENAEFKNWVDRAPQFKEIYDIALKLEDLVLATGQHPSGIGISYEDIETTVPLELSPTKDVISAYDMDDIAEMMVKLDVLGLRNADVNFDTCKLLGISPETINVNHPSIYKFYQESDKYYGLFQIEQGLTRQTTESVKPKNIDELACCIALSRPGTYKDIPKYLKYVHEGKLESIYPEIDKILKKTANILLYQEQVTRICAEVYGLDEISADNVRYGIGKKRRDEIKKWEPVIFAKGKEKGIPEEVTQKIWRTIQDSADYQFSANHCYSYSYMTAINTYLKVNYPKEFFLSLLRMAINESDTASVIRQIALELPYFNIQLLPPHILKSQTDFSIEGDCIRFGLSAIKGIAEANMQKLLQFRVKDLNKFDIFHNSIEAGLPLGVMTSLILCGAFDSGPNENRPLLLAELQLFKLLREKERHVCLDLGPEYNYSVFNVVTAMHKEKKNEKGKPLIKDSRMETIKRNFEESRRIYKENQKDLDFAKWFFERELLGFAYSTSLYEIFKNREAQNLVPVGLISQMEERDVFRVAGEIVKDSLTEGKSKAKGTPYLKFDLSDNSGVVRVMMFETPKSPNLSRCKEYNDGVLPKEKQVVVVRGSKKGDVVFAEVVAVQELAVFSRKSQLKTLDKSPDSSDNKTA